VDFVANSECSLDVISVEDISTLEMCSVGFSDVSRLLHAQIEIGEKTQLDYFRFRPPRAR